MIEFDAVTLTYPDATTPALANVDLHVPEGELCLVVGPTGAGKSTLLGATCARVPHFTGGVLQGSVRVDGRDTATHLPRDLADVVGVVTQDPLMGFVADTVEEELAFALEQLGLPRAVMRKRVEEVLDLLALAPLRDRALSQLSGGEQQRVAIGAVLTAQPKVLVLDEPTSALDPTAAEDVLAALTRLVHDLGITVLLAEHRLERVIHFADSVIRVHGGTGGGADGTHDGAVTYGDPATVLALAPNLPPVVELGRLAGWEPLPLSVRDARRRAAPLRQQLPSVEAGADRAAADGVGGARSGVADGVGSGGSTAADGVGAAGRAASARSMQPVPDGEPTPLLRARGLHVSYGQVEAVAGMDLTVASGEVLAIMGRNGSGKSSLLWALQGSGPRSAGQVRLPSADGSPDPADLSPARARRHLALVPQTPAHLLYHESVAAECDAADTDAGAPAGTTAALVERLRPGLDAAAHPADLSEGGRLALALAVQLAADPPVLLLDEPTRGLDYTAKGALADVLAERARAGAAVVLTSHDVEFVAICADRVLTMAQGQVVADGPAREQLVASPTLAPQVAKILHPLGYLTVAEVRQALAPAPGVVP